MGEPYRDLLQLQRKIEELQKENETLNERIQILSKVKNFHLLLIKEMKFERRVLWVISFTALALMFAQGMGMAIWQRLVE